LLAACNLCDRSGDLSCDECFAAAWRFVIEQDAVHGEHAVSLAVISRDIERICLRTGIGAARIERRRFLLRRFNNFAKNLGRRRLIKPRLELQLAHRIQ
jgi:hypothetical protein